MATINYFLWSKKKGRLAPIFVRLSAGRGTDIIVKTGESIKPEQWSDKTQATNQRIQNSESTKLKDNLADLRKYIEKEFNNYFGVLSKEWLSEVVYRFYNKKASDAETFMEYIDRFIKEAEQRKPNNEDLMNLSKGTITNLRDSKVMLLILFFLAIQINIFSQDKKPIVDIRFESNYFQISNSQGDEWAPTWADDGNLYTGNDDGAGFGGKIGHSISFGKLKGDDPYKLNGDTISDMDGYGTFNPSPDHANWKTMNSYCINGVLYMWVTRCLYPEQSGDLKNRHIFKNSSIIKSTDHGLTWERSSYDNYNNPMFPGLRFGAPYFVWYGKDGEASVDNADKYVYAVSNNGHFEDGDNYILGRVLKNKLPDLNSADWQFYTGGDGMLGDNWTRKINNAKFILQDSMNCSMTGMTYIQGLGRYVMVVWHYTTFNLRKDPRTINEYYEAPRPWGPWTKFKTIDTENLGWYVPVIGQKFQTVVNANTVRCFLYLTGNYNNSRLYKLLYKLNYIPVTLSTVLLSH